jgi:oxaloacetate decarboxylase
LREGTKPAALTGIASAEMMGKVTRSSSYKTWTDDFLA